MALAPKIVGDFQGNVAACIAIAMQGSQGWFVPQQEMQSGGIVAADLPAADPHVAGQLWSNAGVITISAG